MSTKDYWQDYWHRVLVGVAIVVMAGMAIAPMEFKGYPITHSTQFNLSWAFQYQRQFLGGQFYPRWLEFSNFGFGNATFVFYPPMLMVATLPFCIFGDVEFSLIASMGLAALVLALGLYKYSRLYFPRWLSVAIALLGVGSPYFLIDVYQRGAMAEVWAIVWIPWVFFTTQKLIDSSKFDTSKFDDHKSINAISLAIAWGMLGLSHLPTLLITFLVWIAMPVILVPKDLGVKAIIRVCIKCYLSAIAGLIGISFFLLPVILDQPLVQIENVINFSSEYVPQKRLMLDGLLSLAPRLPTHWFESGFGLIPCFGIIAATGMIGAIAWIISLKLKAPDPRLFRAFGIGVLVTVITIFMTTDLSVGIYVLFPTLQKIQFSWRWFVITVTTVPMIWGGMIWQLGIFKKTWLRNLLLIILMLVTLASYSLTDKLILDKTGFDSPLVHKFVTFANQKKFPHEPQVNNAGTSILFWHWLFPDGLGIVDVSEYRAKGVSMAMPPDRNYPLAAWKDNAPTNNQINNPENNQRGIQIKRWNYGFRELAIANPYDLNYLQIRMFYYPGWQLKIDNQNSALTATAQGQVEIAIPSGEHLVTLTYTGTIAERVGKYISLVSIIGTLIWLIWERSQQKLAKSS